jgi:predicted nucleotidyltransferase
MSPVVLTAADHDRLVDAARAVFADAPEVIAAYLYGSAARGEPANDLDVAIVSGSSLTHARIEALAAQLQKKGAPHGPEIDLRPIDEAAARFRATVIREGRLLFVRDEDRRRSFEHRALVEWFDYEPIWRRARERMLARLRDG